MERSWVKVGAVRDIPVEGGTAVRYGKVQLAVFRFESRGEWHASQNMCPHKRDTVLARGLTGDVGTPKVACPMHKESFALTTGECLSDDSLRGVSFQRTTQEKKWALEIRESPFS